MKIILLLMVFVAVQEDGLSELKKALRDPDPKVRVQAAIDLSNLGPKARPALPALFELLKDKDASVRARAVASITQISFVDEKKMLRPVEEIDQKILQALIPFIEDKALEVRRTAIGAVGYGREKSKEAVPKLIAAMKDGQTRTHAITCLGAIGPDAKAAVPALREALKDEKMAVRMAAARALTAIQGN